MMTGKERQLSLPFAATKKEEKAKYPYTAESYWRMTRDWKRHFGNRPHIKEAFTANARLDTALFDRMMIDVVALEDAVDALFDTQDEEMSLEEKIRHFYGSDAVEFIRQLI